jgi:hypothetical protein
MRTLSHLDPYSLRVVMPGEDETIGRGESRPPKPNIRNATSTPAKYYSTMPQASELSESEFRAHQAAMPSHLARGEGLLSCQHGRKWSKASALEELPS